MDRKVFNYNDLSNKNTNKKKTRRRKFDDVDVGRLPVDEPVIIDA